MDLFELISFIVEGQILIQHVPVTFGPIPGAPLTRVRLQLFLLHPDEVEGIITIMQTVQARQALSTWLLSPENPRDGFRFQGYITDCQARDLRPEVVALTLDMDLIPAGS
jgi:hypothetical protein